MHMIRHHTPRMQPVSETVEMLPAPNHDPGIFRLAQKAAAVASVEVAFDFFATFIVIQSLFFKLCQHLVR